MLLYEFLPLINFGNQKKAEGRSLILATIVETQGSSYRKKWTSMLLADDGTYEGALSGGCVEREVVRHAAKVFFHKKPTSFVYDGYSNLGCNGLITVILEFLTESSFSIFTRGLNAIVQHRIPSKRLLGQDEVSGEWSTGFHFDEKDQFFSGTRVTLSDTYSILPHRRLLIFGNEIDGFRLNSMSTEMGFETTSIISPRAKKPTNPNLRYTIAEPYDLTKVIHNIDAYTFILLMTHSKEKDAEILSKIIHYNYLYLGILGPEHRKEEVIASSIKQMDVSPSSDLKAKFSSIYGPIGIDIHAANPEEIAISILAQLISVWNKKKGLISEPL